MTVLVRSPSASSFLITNEWQARRERVCGLQSRPVAGLALLDDRSAITAAVMIGRLTDRYASTNRAGADTNVVRKRRRCNDANDGSSQ